MSGGGGERDLTAVLIGACVGSMTVLIFTIGILAFVYWCCFRERIRWWRKFESAALVIGNPPPPPPVNHRNLIKDAGSLKPGGSLNSACNFVENTAPHSLAAVSTISGSIIQLSNPNSLRSGQTYATAINNQRTMNELVINDYGSKQSTLTMGTGPATTNSLDRTGENIPKLIPALKNSNHHNNPPLVKRPSLNIGNNAHYGKTRAPGPMAKVRPGMSLAALPTSAQSASTHQFYCPQQQQQQQQQQHQQQQHQQQQQQQQQLPQQYSQHQIYQQVLGNKRPLQLPSHVVRRTSYQSQIKLGTNSALRVRGVSVPDEDSPSDENVPLPSTARSTSSSASFNQSAKRWSSMPSIALVAAECVPRDKVVRSTSKRIAQPNNNNNNNNNNNIEEVSSSWRMGPAAAPSGPHVASSNRRRRQTAQQPSTTKVNGRSKLAEVPGSPNFEHESLGVATNSTTSSTSSSSQRQQAKLSLPQQQAHLDKQQMAMMVMTREAQYTFTADEEGSSPEFLRKGKQVESPPPSVSAMVGVLPQKTLASLSMKASVQMVTASCSSNSGTSNNDQQQFGSHSSRVSGDDSAIVVMDSGQSTSSKNNTDVEQATSPMVAQTSTKPTVVKRPSVLKKPTVQPPSPPTSQSNGYPAPNDVSASPVGEEPPALIKQQLLLNGSEAPEDMVSSSMRSKIAKIRRYKQRSRGPGGGGMANMRSMSVADLNRPTKSILSNGGTVDCSAVESSSVVSSTAARGAMRPAQSRQQRRVTGEGFVAASPLAITGHSIGVHVDNLGISRPIPGSPSNSTSSGMRRYATVETLMTGVDNGVYMGRVALAASAGANGEITCKPSLPSRIPAMLPSNAGSSAGESGSEAPSKPVPLTLGARLSVGHSLTINGGSGSVPRGTSAGNRRAADHSSSSTTSSTHTTFNTNQPPTVIYSPTSASYNVEQATRQHQQQLQQQKTTRQTSSLTTALDDDDDDETMSYTDQAKRVTDNAFRFLNEFSEAETQSQRSIENNGDTSPPVSEQAEMLPKFREVVLGVSSRIPSEAAAAAAARALRSSPAPSLTGKPLKPQEVKLSSDWL